MTQATLGKKALAILSSISVAVLVVLWILIQPFSSNPGSTVASQEGFANTRCPIMSENIIDPAHVPDGLVRSYQGQKVAFCCSRCPRIWDQLSETEKQTKLNKVRSAKAPDEPVEKPASGTDHQSHSMPEPGHHH